MLCSCGEAVGCLRPDLQVVRLIDLHPSLRVPHYAWSLPQCGILYCTLLTRWPTMACTYYACMNNSPALDLIFTAPRVLPWNSAVWHACEFASGVYAGEGAVLPGLALLDVASMISYELEERPTSHCRTSATGKDVASEHTRLPGGWWLVVNRVGGRWCYHGAPYKCD